jgi:hypothetical protein
MNIVIHLDLDHVDRALHPATTEYSFLPHTNGMSTSLLTVSITSSGHST